MFLSSLYAVQEITGKTCQNDSVHGVNHFSFVSESCSVHTCNNNLGDSLPHWLLLIKLYSVYMAIENDETEIDYGNVGIMFI